MRQKLLQIKQKFSIMVESSILNLRNLVAVRNTV